MNSFPFRRTFSEGRAASLQPDTSLDLFETDLLLSGELTTDDDYDLLSGLSQEDIHIVLPSSAPNSSIGLSNTHGYCTPTISPASTTLNSHENPPCPPAPRASFCCAVGASGTSPQLSAYMEETEMMLLDKLRRTTAEIGEISSHPCVLPFVCSGSIAAPAVSPTQLRTGTLAKTLPQRDILRPETSTSTPVVAELEQLDDLSDSTWVPTRCESRQNNAKTNKKATGASKAKSRGTTAAATNTTRRRRSRTTGTVRAAAEISYEDLQKLFDVPSEEAAARLGVGCTTFKKLCRSHNITRWPQRTRKSLREMERNLSAVGDMLCSEDERALVLEQIKDGIGSVPSAELLKLRQKIFKTKHNLKRKVGTEEASL